MRIKKGKDFLLNLITTMVIKIQPCSFGLEWFAVWVLRGNSRVLQFRKGNAVFVAVCAVPVILELRCFASDSLFVLAGQGTTFISCRLTDHDILKKCLGYLVVPET